MSTERPDLDAIEALLAAATPGPWWIERDGCDDTCTLVGGPDGAWRNIAEFPFYAQFRHEPDERLIAAAPTALRTLLAYARALESDRDYLQERVNDLNEQYAALERERDAAQADRDALAAGLDAISDILDGMIEGASREETKDALYKAAIKAWEVAVAAASLVEQPEGEAIPMRRPFSKG